MQRFTEEDGIIYDDGIGITARCAIMKLNHYCMEIALTERQRRCGCLDNMCKDCRKYGMKLEREFYKSKTT